MKIGIDARLIRETGVGRYIQNLLANLANSDDKSEYIVFLPPHSYDTFVLPNNRWQKRKTAIRWHSIKEQLILPFLFHRERLDLLHIPYFTVPLLYPGAVILTIHDLTILHVNTGKATTLPYPLYVLKRLAYKIILFFGVRKARHIISVSHTTKQDLQSYLSVPSGKITVTYEGIDTIFTKKVSGTSPVKSPFFLYVGNVYPHKQTDFLIDCFLELKKKNSFLLHKNHTKLVFVGKHDYFYEQLKNKLEAVGLSDEILFFHNATDVELRLLYQDALALLFPSAMEGFGLPPLEALSLGCPVLTLDIPVFREILGDEGIRLPMSTDAWIHSMEDIAQHPKKYDISDQKTLMYLNKFSWKRMTEQTISLYENCVGVRSSK